MEHYGPELLYALSQWSLTFEVRKRKAALNELLDALASQWSLTFEVRKRPASPDTTRICPRCRNGA